jgi:hypothetical protein
VKINGERFAMLGMENPPAELVIQVGKQWRRVTQ